MARYELRVEVLNELGDRDRFSKKMEFVRFPKK